MSDALNVIIERDTYDSILYAVLGGLLLLSTYHLVLYFQNRDKSYLLYSSYTFFSFLAYMPVAESGFLHDLSQYLHFDYRSKQFFTIIFNCIYFLFFTRFLNIKRTNPKWNQIIVIPVYFYLIITVSSYVLLKFGNEFVFNFLYKVFIYFITIHTVISFYLLIKLDNNLKYYIIIGGVILYLCCMIGEETVRNLPSLMITKKMGDFIFFAGLIVENMAFSFALGHRQRNIYREKVAFSKNFIFEMRKNEQLKDKINLQNEIKLSAENEKMKWQQEISDLKLAILQTQMNPHFIFNALNSIKYYILDNDSENAVFYLTKFSKIIRTILVSSTIKEFTLEEELQTLQVYVDIENLRFNKEISFNILIDEKINSEELKLPPMVLQPFIENAILHGIALVEDKKIDLHVVTKDQHIEIRIIDNGVGRKEAERNKIRHKNLGKSFGTKIAAGMLKNYFWPKPYKIEYHDLHQNGQPTGTMVVLEIPAC